MKKVLNAMQTIKDFCISQGDGTSCLKCPLQNLCSQFFDEQPYNWGWDND